MTAPTAAEPGSLITPLTLAQVAALTPPDAASLSQETQALLVAALGYQFADLMGYVPGPGSLNTVTFRMIGPHAPDVTMARIALLQRAYAEAGFAVPMSNGKDLSDLMDAFNGVEFESVMEHNLTAYGIQMALSQLDLDVAKVLADGRMGAGFFWDEIRTDLRFNAGLPPLGELPFEIPA